MSKSKDLNWKLIFFHFLGMLCFALAFQSFAYLTALPLAESLRHSGTAERDIIRQQAGATTLNDLYFSIEIARTIGFILGLVFSLVICAIRKWYWVNSAVSLIIILLLGFTDMLGWSFKVSMFLFSANFLPGASYYIVIGSLVLVVGIFLFLLKRPIESENNKRIRERYA